MNASVQGVGTSLCEVCQRVFGFRYVVCGMKK